MKLTRDQIRVKLKAPELGASPALQFKLTGRISKPLTVPELELELELELAVPGRPDDELLEPNRALVARHLSLEVLARNIGDLLDRAGWMP